MLHCLRLEQADPGTGLSNSLSADICQPAMGRTSETAPVFTLFSQEPDSPPPQQIYDSGFCVVVYLLTDCTAATHPRCYSSSAFQLTNGIFYDNDITNLSFTSCVANVTVTRHRCGWCVSVPEKLGPETAD